MLPLLPVLQPGALSMAQVGSGQGRFLVRTLNGRQYKLFVPSGYDWQRSVPLLVMLHGCSQDPGDFAVGTEMNRYAEQHNFAVVYPDQPRQANRLKCWNWFQPAHQMRGAGEPADIVAVVEQVSRELAVDVNRVYVAGISAGAAMAVILGATYPDVFAALGVCSGVAYKASTSLPRSLVVMARGARDTRSHGTLVYQAMGAYRRVMPVVVFHGTGDATVSPRNAEQVTAQWLRANQMIMNGTGRLEHHDNHWIPEVMKSGVPGGRSYTEFVYRDPSGTPLIRQFLVDGMKHGWSGGSPAGSFTDPHGPGASQVLVDFLLRHALRAPTEPVVAPPAIAESVIPSGAHEPEPGWQARLGRAFRRLVRRLRS